MRVLTAITACVIIAMSAPAFSQSSGTNERDKNGVARQNPGPGNLTDRGRAPTSPSTGNPGTSSTTGSAGDSGAAGAGVAGGGGGAASSGAGGTTGGGAGGAGR